MTEPHEPHHTDDQLDDASRFIVKVGTEALAYGASAPRVGDYLTRLAKSLGLRAGFLTWPNHILYVVQDRRHLRQHVEVKRLPSGSVELDRLAQVGAVVDEVVDGGILLERAVDSLDDIARAPSPWGRRAVAASYAAVGLALAVVLDGSWLDAVLAGALSLVVYGLVLLFGRLGDRWTDSIPLVTAFVPAAVAALARYWHPQVDVLVVTIAAIAILLPGYAVSIGIGELLENHVIAGLTNLLSGLVYLAKQVLGAWMGAAVVLSFVDPPPAPAARPVPVAWLLLLMPVLIVGLCVVFQTSRRDLPWVAVSCGLAFGTYLAGDAWLNANLGTLIAAAITAIFANLWAARTGRPTSIVQLPAVVVLVSGTVGFQGIASLAEGETSVGAQQFVQMFVVAVMITAGWVLGNTIVRPRTTL